jgi:hypothetical protein
LAFERPEIRNFLKPLTTETQRKTQRKTQKQQTVKA